MNGCKWNGTIKEYYILNGKLRLKGEYLNWKIYGKGKEYDYEEKIFFWRRTENWKKKWKGKKYENGKLLFEWRNI